MQSETHEVEQAEKEAREKRHRKLFKDALNPEIREKMGNELYRLIKAVVDEFKHATNDEMRLFLADAYWGDRIGMMFSNFDDETQARLFRLTRERKQSSDTPVSGWIEWFRGMLPEWLKKRRKP